MTKKSEFVDFRRAIDLLHRKDTRLVRMNGKDSGFYIVPNGGPVSHETATAILKRPDVISGKDGLFPDTAQTWRLI